MKGFITHGGLLSITEAVYYGVPFVGFPGFGDQHYNLINAARRGIGIKLDLNELTEENFEKAIRAILENARYQTKYLVAVLVKTVSVVVIDKILKGILPYYDHNQFNLWILQCIGWNTY